MRQLSLPDAFAVSRIIKAADIKNEIVKFSREIISRKNKKQEINIEEIGLEFVITIINSIADEKIEEKIYSLLASICETDVDTVKKYSFKQLKDIITEIIAENDLKSFFQSASALT